MTEALQRRNRFDAKPDSFRFPRQLDPDSLDSLRIVVAVVLVFAATAHSSSAAQPQENPQTIVISSGQLALRALIWRPSGRGPFPAVLFNHGSYSTDDPISMEDSRALGSLFAKHGYFFVFLFREGVGLSGGQGIADGDRMARALIADGQEGRNRVQLRLLEHDALDEALAALAWLRACPDVDKHRIAVGGHSFGGSLSLLIAAQAPDLCGAIIFAGAAASWDQSPPLRALLLEAVGNISAPRLPRPRGKRLFDSTGQSAGRGDGAAGTTPSFEDLSGSRTHRTRWPQPRLPLARQLAARRIRLS
jgi:dienelactone hydrolase